MRSWGAPSTGGGFLVRPARHGPTVVYCGTISQSIRHTQIRTHKTHSKERAFLSPSRLPTPLSPMSGQSPCHHLPGQRIPRTPLPPFPLSPLASSPVRVNWEDSRSKNLGNAARQANDPRGGFPRLCLQCPGHFQDTPIFLADLQNRELPFTTHPPHRSCLYAPSSCSSTTHTAHHTTQHFTGRRRTAHLPRARHGARSPHTTSGPHAALPGRHQDWKWNTGGHSPPPAMPPLTPYQLSAHTRVLFLLASNVKPLTRGKEGPHDPRTCCQWSGRWIGFSGRILTECNTRET